MSKNKYAVVIGASNIDIGGTPYRPLIQADSNPGKINISYGGVGRNIAHDLSLLGINTRLITASGNDPLGKDMLVYCRNAGIDTSSSIISDDHISSTYIYINDINGDMHIALSDMDICKLITPDYIDNMEELINGAAAIAADCNLSYETLMHIKKICRVPVFIDTVSVTKSSRIKNDLNGIFAVKPNRLEAEELSGIIINNSEDYIRAAEIIIDKGVKNVFISMGAEGMLAANENNAYLIGRYDTDIVNTTGAGDSATAALIWSYISSNDPDNYLIEAAAAANAAASLTLQSHGSVNPEMTADKVIEKIKIVEKRRIK